MNSPSTRRSWHEMRRLQRQMEQLIGGLSPTLGWPLTAKDPPINITRAGDHLIIDALCPGVDKETIDVTVVGTVITLHGDRGGQPTPTRRFTTAASARRARSRAPSR